VLATLVSVSEGRVVRVRSRNDVFQLLEALKRSRAKRRRERACFVESVAAIDAAIREGWEVLKLVRSAARRPSAWAAGLADRCPRSLIIELDDELMAELSDREETSELVAVVRLPEREPPLPRPSPYAALLLDRPSNPGNLGSALRSADAFGAAPVLIRGHAADPFDPHCIRSSLGAVFSVPLYAERSNSWLDVWLEELRRELPRLQVVGTSPTASLLLPQVDFRRPTVLVMGNERAGMSEWLRGKLDCSAAIPCGGRVDSLNLAAATSVALYELARQRGEVEGRA